MNTVNIPELYTGSTKNINIYIILIYIKNAGVCRTYQCTDGYMDGPNTIEYKPLRKSILSKI